MGQSAAEAGAAEIPGPRCAMMTIIIPERGSPEMLGACLDSVAAAAGQLAEPVQVLVVVNGSPGGDYSSLRSRHREVEFVIEERALTFSGAVREGLKRALYDWVYLLNNDMILDAAALRAFENVRAGVYICRGIADRSCRCRFA